MKEKKRVVELKSELYQKRKLLEKILESPNLQCACFVYVMKKEDEGMITFGEDIRGQMVGMLSLAEDVFLERWSKKFGPTDFDRVMEED